MGAWERWGVLRYGHPRQPRSDTADTRPDAPSPPVVDRREISGSNGRETEAADVGTRPPSRGGQRGGGSNGKTGGENGGANA